MKTNLGPPGTDWSSERSKGWLNNSHISIGEERLLGKMSRFFDSVQAMLKCTGNCCNCSAFSGMLCRHIWNTVQIAPAEPGRLCSHYFNAMLISVIGPVFNQNCKVLSAALSRCICGLFFPSEFCCAQ